MSKPTISGFTFIKNGIKLGYPFIEAIRTLLQCCDEVIVAVGNSEDDTLEKVRSISDSIQIIETVWDDTLRQGGKILAQQTNIALAECKGDWCLYLQGDELFHEKDLHIIKEDIYKANSVEAADGLLFPYKHFFGSYKHICTGRQWYRYEIRAFKNHRHVFSWKDAQGFRKMLAEKPEKLRVLKTAAYVYHYGYVRPPLTMQQKAHDFSQLYSSRARIDPSMEFDYEANMPYDLGIYTGEHPALIHDKIRQDEQWTQHFAPPSLTK